MLGKYLLQNSFSMQKVAAAAAVVAPRCCHVAAFLFYIIKNGGKKKTTTKLKQNNTFNFSHSLGFFVVAKLLKKYRKHNFYFMFAS